MEPAMPADPIIPDRGEFIDALRALGRGRVTAAAASSTGSSSTPRTAR
jgi:hypothetical protein